LVNAAKRHKGSATGVAFNVSFAFEQIVGLAHGHTADSELLAQDPFWREGRPRGEDSGAKDFPDGCGNLNIGGHCRLFVNGLKSPTRGVRLFSHLLYNPLH
jgi:hypothetical protein